MDKFADERISVLFAVLFNSCIVHAYCSSLYCCSLWSNYTQQMYTRMRVAYNNIFRSLMHVDRRSSVSKAFIEYDIDAFEVLIRKNICSLRNRLFDSENVLIQAITNFSHFLLGSKINSMWSKKLF